MGWNLHSTFARRLSEIKKHSRDGNELAHAQLLTLKLQPPPQEHIHLKQDSYQYEWKKGPQQDDFVIRSIISVIKELKRDHCSFANANVKVWSTTDEAPIWLWGPSWSYDPYQAAGRTKLYTFTQEMQEVPITVQVTLLPPFTRPFEDTIHVKLPVSRVWVPVKEWLLTIRDPDAIHHRTAFEEHRIWWRRNGRHFPFLKLPLDCQRIIYEYAIGPEIFPLSRYTTATTAATWSSFEAWSHTPGMGENISFVLGVGYSKYKQYWNTLDFMIPNAATNANPPNLALLRVSKEVHQEALKVAWESTKKHFFDSTMFALVAESVVGPAARFNCFSRVQLSLSWYDWFDFFGVKVQDYSKFILGDEPANAEYLKKDRLPNLKVFEMRFRNPLKDLSWFYRTLASCSHTSVNMVCTFGFPFVSHIGNVKIMGYVKKDTKIKWEAIYSQKPQRYNSAMAIEALLDTPDNVVPAQCSCNTPWMPTREDSVNGTDDDEYMFDFEDWEIDNKTVNEMDGYGGSKPGAPLYTGRLCACGCGYYRHEVHTPSRRLPRDW